LIHAKTVSNDQPINKEPGEDRRRTMRFDHHLHTSRHSPDSEIDPLELVEHAREIGLDGIVITEHDYQWEPGELVDLAGRAAPLRVFSGAEISAREGHFLVYGLPDLDEIPPGVDLAELLRVVRGHDGAIVAAHPFRWDQPFKAIVAEHGAVFDALELVSKNITRETRSQTEALLRAHPMGATGSSDAHEIRNVGCYFTEFDRPIESIRDFVAALRERRGRPRHRDGARLASGPVPSP
jgi:predicted metal-dependent phosphoesterase TrpH